MRLLIINPNTTAEMTESVAAAAKLAARPGTEIVALNPSNGPASIQGPEDGAAALPGLFALFEAEVAEKGGYDGVIIACFDDTGLLDLKERSPVPVIGIGEAGYHAAMLAGRRFSVVTTLAVSVPVLEANIARYGFAPRCAKVRAAGVPVLDLEFARDAAERKVAKEAERAIAEDGCDAIVLGCAGMADLARDMRIRFGIPVVDGVAAAVALAEALANAGVGVPEKGEAG